MSLTPVYICGYEVGLQTYVSSGGGLADYVWGDPEVQSTIKRSGSYAMRFRKTVSGTAAYRYWIGGSSDYLVGSLYVRLDTAPSSAFATIAFTTVGGTELSIYFDNNRYFHARVGGGSAQTGPQAALGQWYRVDFRIYSGASAVVEWKIDGVTQTNATNTITGGYCDECAFGFASSQTADYTIDDVVLSVTSGDYPINNGKAYEVLGIRPNADGTHSLGSSLFQDGDNNVIDGTEAWDHLEEKPWVSTQGGSDLIKQVGTGAANYVEVEFEDVPEGYSILGVMGLLQYSGAGTDPNEGGCVVLDKNDQQTEIWGTPSSRQAYNVTSSYYKSAIISTPAQGWTREHVNLLRGRIGYSNDVTPNPYWQAMMLEVLVSGIALDYFTGYEHGNDLSSLGGGLANSISGAANQSVQSTYKKNGTYAWRATVTASTAAYETPTMPQSYYTVVSFWMNIRSASDLGVEVWHTMDVSAYGLGVILSGSGYKIVSQEGNSADGTQSAELAFDTWYLVDCLLDMSTTTIRIDFMVNGIPYAQYTWSDVAEQRTILHVGPCTSSTLDIVIDDFIVSGDPAAYPLGGAFQVIGRSPDGPGTSVPGTATIQDNGSVDVNDSTNPANVELDEVPMDSVADYIKQVLNGGGNYAEVTFADLPGASGVMGVRAILAYTSSTATANHGKATVEGDSPDTIYDGDMSETSLFYKSKIVTEPSSGWTKAKADALKARVGMSTNCEAANVPYWQSLILEVYYLEGGVVKGLAGEVSAQSSVVGSFKLGWLPAGQIDGISSCSGDLSVGAGVKVLQGTVDAVSGVADALMRRLREFVGVSIDGLSAIADVPYLHVTRRMVCEEISGVSSVADASLKRIKTLVGEEITAVSSVADGIAKLIKRMLVITTEGTSSAIGIVRPLRRFDPEDIASVSSVDGTLRVSKPLIGTVDGLSNVPDSPLSVSRELIGIPVDGISSVEGFAKVTKELVGVPIDGISAVSGDISIQGTASIKGTVDAVSDVPDALLEVTKGFVGEPIDGISSVSGVLRVTKPLVGEPIDGISSAVGALKRVKSIAGESIDGISSVGGVLKKSRRLVVEPIDALSGVSGILKPFRGLVGVPIDGISAADGVSKRIRRLIGVSIDVVSSVEGDLSISGKVNLAGVVGAVSNVPDSTIWIKKRLPGTCGAYSGAAGFLRVRKELAGTSDGVSGAEAQLSSLGTVTLAGTIDAVSSVPVTPLEISRKLIGVVTSFSGCDGVLKVSRKFTVSPVSSLSDVSGLLKPSRKLVGVIDGISGVAGVSKVARELTGAVDSFSSVLGILETGKELKGSVGSLSDVYGGLKVTKGFIGSIGSVSGVDATVRIYKPLVGAVDSLSSITGLAKVTRGLVGPIDAVSGITGYLSKGKEVTLAGVVGAVSTVTGRIVRPTLTFRGTVSGVSSVAATTKLLRKFTAVSVATSGVVAPLRVLKVLIGSPIDAVSDVTGTLEWVFRYPLKLFAHYQPRVFERDVKRTFGASGRERIFVGGVHGED